MKVRNKLIAMGNSLGVPVIDLGPSLSAATKPLRPTYFTFDVHWNGRGHDVASSAVFDWMRETRSLPPSCGGDLKTQAATAFVWDPATGTLPR